MMKYTDEHLDFLRKHETTPRKELAEKFNKKFKQKVTSDALGQKCVKIGLVCPNNGRFKKGHVPFCSGKKGFMKANKTSFTPGTIPKNTKRVGSIVANKDKNGRYYLRLKIAEPNKWKMLHLYIWEQKYGKVPKGSCIIFKDKDTLNVRPDNLMLITRKELVRLNQKYASIDGSLKDVALQVIKIQNEVTKKKA